MYRGPVVSAARSSVGFRVLCFALWPFISLVYSVEGLGLAFSFTLLQTTAEHKKRNIKRACTGVVQGCMNIDGLGFGGHYAGCNEDYSFRV